MSAIVRSFFIPAVDYKLTKNNLKECFSRFGQVCRIDFVSHNKPNGVVRRAYIHFSEYTFENQIENDISIKGHCDYYCQLEGGFTMRILINNNPIPQTELNLDQVASNTIFIGDQLQELEKRMNHYEHVISVLLQRDAYYNQVITNMQSMPPVPPVPYMKVAPSLDSPTMQIAHDPNNSPTMQIAPTLKSFDV